MVECDVPWYPFQGKPSENAKVIQIARDPNYSGIPIRSFPKDISIGGDPKSALELLAQELKRQPRNEILLAERAQRIRAQHKQYRERAKQKAEKASGERPIDTAWLSYCVDQVRDSDTLIVNDHGVSQEHLSLSEPASYFGGSPAGGLGWGIGGALGMKLAHPEKTVIASVGDGTYMFNNPTACHFVSQAYDLPMLTIVCNNAIWHSTKAATQQVMPDGWAVSTENFPLCDLKPAPRYEMVVAAHGGYGELVDDPQQLLPALKRALKVVREEKRQAVLNVICGTSLAESWLIAYGLWHMVPWYHLYAISHQPYAISPACAQVAKSGPTELIATSLFPRDFLEQFVPSFQGFVVLTECSAFFGIPALEPIVLLSAAKVQVFK